MADPSVTFETERNCIVLVVTPIGINVVHLNKNVACLFTKAAVAVTPQKKLISEVRRKWHVNSL